jgi:HPt (histidine-containing phosphotransfer) domain-containing protein
MGWTFGAGAGAEPAVTELPDFDAPEWIREFRSEGAEAEVREMLGVFAAENERRRAPLRAAAEAGDLAELARLAHATKGSSGSFGAERLHDLAVRLEERALTGQAADAAALAADMDEAFERAAAAMRLYLDDIECPP